MFDKKYIKQKLASLIIPSTMDKFAAIPGAMLSASVRSLGASRRAPGTVIRGFGSTEPVLQHYGRKVPGGPSVKTFKTNISGQV